MMTRAKNIDRSAIEGHAKDGDFMFALVVQKELRQWLQDNFGETIVPSLLARADEVIEQAGSCRLLALRDRSSRAGVRPLLGHGIADIGRRQAGMPRK